MGVLKGITARLRAFVRRDKGNRELDEEIRFHIDLETAKNIGLGMSPDEARRRAYAAFGGVRRIKEEHEDVRGAPWLEQTLADARYAVRGLIRGPGIAVAAILTIALGIGANTMIFSAVNAVVLRPLPFTSPNQLFMLWEENPEKGWYKETAAPANLLDWREQVPGFKDVGAFSDFTAGFTLTGEGAPRMLQGAMVTGNLFSLLGVRPHLGRSFRNEETWQTDNRIMVLSFRTWRDQFRGDSAIVGRTLQIEGRPRQVVGVMPEGFAFPKTEVEFWKPMEWPAANREQIFFRRAHWVRPIARLNPSVTPEQANAQLQEVVRRLQSKYPETNKLMGAGMTPLHEFLVGKTRLPLLVLLGAVALLLLIACANVGNLLLVRAADRERETALRLALGASRNRVVRQALTESLMLSGIGGAFGLALGWIGTRLLVVLQPEGMLRVRDFGVDWMVLLYVLGITTISGIMFGIAPALWSGRRQPAEALKEGGRTGSSSQRMRRWGDLLVIGEVALSLLLTIGAGLLVRSFWELRNVNPGFEPNGVLAVWLDLPSARYDSSAKVTAFYEQLLERVRALPGATGAAAVQPVPLTGSGYTSDFIVAGRASGEYGTEVTHRRVVGDYFQTMKVPLLSGRVFTTDDRGDAPSVTIINEALARSYFRGQDPIGQRITFDKVPDSTSTWSTIVGVVGNEYQRSLAEDSRIEAFTPMAQDVTTGMALVARTSGDAAALAPSIRRIVAELDPSLAIEQIRTLQDVRTQSMARERFLMILMIVFAVVGLVLVVVGVYGVLAQLARRRTREIGIRIALGAQGSQVRWLVVGHGLRLTVGGLLIGGATALLATRAMQGLLFRIAPVDPVTFGAVALLLASTSVIASWVPALKASRADPSLALRGE